MDSEIVIAVMSLLGTLCGSLSGIFISAKLTNYRLRQLENRVAEHNNFAYRLPVIEEQIKELSERMEEIRNERKAYKAD